MVTVLLRAVPYDAKDDVVEQFLSKILPGSGTIYRSEPHHAGVDDDRTSSTSVAAGTGSTPPTATRQTAQRTSAAATRSPIAMEVKSALHQEALSLRKKKRRVCKTVPMVSSGEIHVNVKIICYHVSDATSAPK